MEKTKKKKYFNVALRVAIASAIFIFAVVNFKTLSNLDVKAILQSIDNKSLVIGASIGIYALKACVFVIPASAIYLAVGMVLKSWLGIAVNLAGIIVELTVSYLLGLFLGGESVKKLISKNEKGRKLLEKDIQNSKTACFTLRFFCAPIDFVSLIYGSLKSNFLSFLILSFAGVAPRVILLSIFGDKFWDFFNMKIIMTLVVIAIPPAIAYYLVKVFWLDKRKKKKEESEIISGGQEADETAAAEKANN